MTDNERLSQELRDRAELAGGHPISLDDVKRSATKLTWQRRAATGAVAAVVLAIGVPVSFAVVDGGPDSNGTPPVANTPTATPTVSVPDKPEEVTLTVDGAPRGGEPGVVYVLDKQILEPDGTATDVEYDYYDVAAFGNGWIGLRFEDGGSSLADVLRGDGSVERSFPSSYGLAVSSQGGEVAAFEFTSTGGVLTRYADGEPEQTWNFAMDVTIEPVGILGDGSVVYTTEGADPVAMVARAAEGDTQPLPGTMSAGGVADDAGLVTGMVSVDEMVPESCWNIFDASGAKQWDEPRCEYTLGAFSPDERLVVGHPTYRDGIGDGLVSIIDPETGKALVEYDTPDDSFISGDAVWEDDTHILALVYSPEGWHIVRLDTEGNIENVNGAALPGDEMSAPVQLGAQPWWRESLASLKPRRL